MGVLCVASYFLLHYPLGLVQLVPDTAYVEEISLQLISSFNG